MGNALTTAFLMVSLSINDTTMPHILNGTSGGGANIEFGGGSNGQIISYVSSRNPRGWSCMHVIESGDNSNPCTNATVTNNDIGPCGEQGIDANGNTLWADVSRPECFACSNPLTHVTGYLFRLHKISCLCQYCYWQYRRRHCPLRRSWYDGF